MEKIGYKGKSLLDDSFNPLNLENAMKNEKINQNLDSNRTLTASNEDELQFLLQAQSVYRETHQVASKADPKTLIDDTELAVILKGNKLLRDLLENTVNKEIKKMESEDARVCPECKDEQKLRNQGSKKK